MTGKISSIKKRDVKPGMFVHSYGCGTFHDPFVAVDRFVRSYDDIAKYLPEDTAQVDIIEDKMIENNVVKKGGERSIAAAAADLAAALPAARKVHEEALDYARKFIGDVQNGKEINIAEAEPIVGQVIESISNNEAAAITLAFLKKYDEYTFTHSINVNLYSLLLGKAIGLNKDELKDLGLAAMFHDVGKGLISSSLLNKPGKLTANEFETMKSHSLQGLKLLGNVEGLNEDVLRGVVEHHERYDGKGYPRRIEGSKIHRFARIIGICDVYDALTSVRIYKKAVAPAKTLSLMFKLRGTDFDPEYFDSFIRVMGIYPPGTMVQLEDMRYAIVLETNELFPLKPMVKVLFNRRMQPIISECVDLAASGEDGKELKVLRQPLPDSMGIDMKQLSRFLA